MRRGYVIYVPKPEILPDMYTEGTEREWTIEISKANILDYVSKRSMDIARRDESVSTENILRDIDKDVVITGISDGIANIIEVLARRMKTTMTESSGTMTFKLTVGDNHDDSMKDVLTLRINDYLNEYALRKWNHADTNDSTMLDKLNKIRSSLEYRKHGLLRRTRSMF